MVGNPYKWGSCNKESDIPEYAKRDIPQSFIENIESDTGNMKGLKRQIDISRAKDYLIKNEPEDGSDCSDEYGIINDLIRIIENK